MPPPERPTYDWTPDLRRDILVRLTTLNIYPLICAVCKQDKWTMPDGFATTPLLKNVWTNERISGLPSVALVCDTCGHTLFLNLGALGFSERVAPDIKKIMDDARSRRGY
jgi:hypothetical protein